MSSNDAADRSSPEIRVSRVTARPSPFADTGKRERFDSYSADRAAKAQAGILEPPSSEELLHTVLELNRSVGVEMQDEAIVHRYVELFGALFPRRRFAVRLLDPEGPERLELVYATGRLAPEGRERVALSDDALERHELEPESVRAAGFDITETYRSIFDAPGVGFDVPLLQGDILVGVMCVEYEPEVAEPAFDRSLIVPIAVQLAAALRNSRLLRESNYLRDNLSKLLDHANAPIVVIGRERELRVVNRAFLALTGAARDTLLGRDFLHLLPETERGRILPVFIRALRGEPTSNFEVRVPRRAGGHSRIVINTASILSTDGEIEGVIAIGRDLTELRELEGQVIQAEKLATLGQLAAGVVHELNNPLTSISVYGEYLLRKGQRAEWEEGDLEKLRRIVESADRILRFTRDLVTYARPSTEEPNFVQLRNVLEQSLLFCEHVVREANAKVDRRYAVEGAAVYAVKGQLHQVFINLITNACHAIDGGGGDIRLAIEDHGDDHVKVVVEDSGPGIPEPQRGQIFEPFFSTKGEGKGTGLGLSIVKNIVQQHGGTIAVTEAELGGARFEIVLPARP